MNDIYLIATLAIQRAIWNLSDAQIEQLKDFKPNSSFGLVIRNALDQRLKEEYQ